KTETGLTALLSDGATIDADIVISAIGLRPRIDLAKAAGIRVNRGVVVNRQLQTSDTHVYALGDCKEIEENVTLYVLPLMAEARTLAKTLTGDITDIKYAPMPVMVKTPCCPIVVSPVPAGVNGNWTDEANEGNNVKSLFHDSDGQLRGFALTGDLIKEKAALAKEVPTLLS
ncbi:MAG: FAD-dependent oxidoreductase, partial [Porticoccus sp.]